MGNLLSRVGLPFDWCLDNNRSATKVERFWRELNSLRPLNLGGVATGLNRLKHGRKTLLQVIRDIVMWNRWFFTCDVSWHATEQSTRRASKMSLKAACATLCRVPPQVAQVKRMLRKRYCVENFTCVWYAYKRARDFFIFFFIHSVEPS